MAESRNKQTEKHVYHFNWREEQQHGEFTPLFRMQCSTYFSKYFYATQGGRQLSIRDTIINKYLQNHNIQTRTDLVIIKALREEADNIYQTLPTELKEITKGLTHNYAKGKINSNKALREIWHLYKKDRLKGRLKDLIAYYVIMADVAETNVWRNQAKKLHPYTVFQPSCTAYYILEWYKRIKNYIRSLKFQNEWFAIYFAMYPYLQHNCHTQKEFVKLMQAWFPRVKTPCSYDSISDYNFLLKYEDHKLWSKVSIEVGTKATLAGIEKIHKFLCDIIESSAPIHIAHYMPYL